MALATKEDIERLKRTYPGIKLLSEDKMKIVDHAGNSLKIGRLLRWIPTGQLDLYVKVKDVVAPDDKIPGRLVVELTFGIEPQVKKNGAIQFKDFVTVMDPEDELRAEAVLEKVEDNVRTMSAR